MIDIKQQPVTQEIKTQILKGFSRHSITVIGHDGFLEPVALVAMDGKALAGAVVCQLFWELFT